MATETFESFVWNEPPKEGVAVQTRLDVYRHPLFSDALNRAMAGEIVNQFTKEVQADLPGHLGKHFTCRPYAIGEGPVFVEIQPDSPLMGIKEPEKPQRSMLLVPEGVAYSRTIHKA